MGVINGRYVSVRRNAEKVSQKFGYDRETGYFGSKYKNKRGSYNRNIYSNNPERDARKLFNALKEGGVLYDTGNPNVKTYRLPDGTYISLRIVTSTKGSPAVEISLKSNPYNTKVKEQKIHFVQKENNND